VFVVIFYVNLDLLFNLILDLIFYLNFSFEEKYIFGNKASFFFQIIYTNYYLNAILK